MTRNFLCCGVVDGLLCRVFVYLIFFVFCLLLSESMKLRNVKTDVDANGSLSKSRAVSCCCISVLSCCYRLQLISAAPLLTELDQFGVLCRCLL